MTRGLRVVTLVLLIFGVMLTAQGPFLTMKASAAEWAISAVAGLLLLAVLIVSIVGSSAPRPTGPAWKYAPQTRLNKGDSKSKSDDGARSSRYTDMFGEGFVGVGVGPAPRHPSTRGRRRHRPAGPGAPQARGRRRSGARTRPDQPPRPPGIVRARRLPTADRSARHAC